MPEFLLEVGCEEIPAPWLPGLTEQLHQRFQELAAREHLAPERIEAYSTPRRLVVASQLLARQPDRQERIWGPALPIAQDEKGQWKPPAHGFAKKQGVPIDHLNIGSKGQPLPLPPTLYVYVDKRFPGKPAVEVLSPLLAELLRALSFPKRMSWDAWLEDGKGAFPFGRPIRWLVVLLGDEIVPFAIYALEDGGRGPIVVASGDRTWGHRFLRASRAGQPIAVRSLAQLKDGLRQNLVLLDPAEREARIRQGLSALGAGASLDDHGLMTEWRDLVEYPTVVAGAVPPEFQRLPVEVLETVLVHHQKYIPLTTEGRGARFAAVTNTDGQAASEIVRGMERVVVARLRDAAFFLVEDSKRALDDRIEDLAGVVFHRDLGTYHEKVERMAGLVRALANYFGSGAEAKAAERAALLAKADLTTLMVREFPELQGVMGGLYLERQGAAPEVAKAVRWHYHPVSVEEGSAPAGAFPDAHATRVFAAVSLADKLDTLAGYFGLGLEPKGSSDPYGLRRAAQGVVRVLLDFWNHDGRRPSLAKLIEAAAQGYSLRSLAVDTTKTARNLKGFLLDRIEHVFHTRGFPADEVSACVYAEDPQGSPVFSSDPPKIQALEDVYDCYARLKALHKVRAEAPDDFAHLSVAFKRAKNIVREQQGFAAPVPLEDVARTEIPAAERELGDAVRRLAGVDGSYEDRLRSLATLRQPVDRFFDDVLVMAEDQSIRTRRLRLLSHALSLFYRIADISKLGG